jgi:hypothetical protein
MVARVVSVELKLLSQKKDTKIITIKYLAKRINNMAQGMTRVDGSKKSSRGWLGPIKRDDGGVMTEYSIGINIGGKETLVPSLVPTLSKDEIEFLRTKEDAVPIPEAIQRKAADHAKKMIEQGKSPFYQQAKKKKSLIK